MIKKKQIVYEPNQRAKTGWIRSWIILFKNVIEYRELIYQLWRRDFLMQYKKSFLGMGWLIFAPIMGIVSWVFMNATGVLTPGDVGIPYPAYVLLSTTIFGLFSGFFGATASSLQTTQGFINQVNFAHDVIIVKQGLQQLSSFLITFTVSVVALFFFGVFPSWKIIFFPLMVFPIFFIGAAMGMIVSVISVVFPDITRVVNFVVGLLLYVTPVIYSPKFDNDILQIIIKYNPLTYIIGDARDLIIYGRIENLQNYCISIAGALILFLVAWRFFYISEEKVIEKMI